MEDKILSFYLDDLPHDYSWIAALVVVVVVMVVVIVGVVCHQRLSSHKPAKDVGVQVRYICNNLCTNDWCIVYLVTKACGYLVTKACGLIFKLSDGNDLCTCTHDWWILWDGCGQFSCPTSAYLHLESTMRSELNAAAFVIGQYRRSYNHLHSSSAYLCMCVCDMILQSAKLLYIGDYRCSLPRVVSADYYTIQNGRSEPQY